MIEEWPVPENRWRVVKSNSVHNQHPGGKDNIGAESKENGLNCLCILVKLSLLNLLPNLYRGMVHFYVYIQAKDAYLNSSSFKKYRTTPYIPQWNRMFESIDITLQQMLAMFVYAIHYTWNDYLYFITSAYGISVQEGTKWTFNCIMLGRETLLLPIDVMVESPINIDEPHCPVLMLSSWIRLCNLLFNMFWKHFGVVL